MNGTGLERAGEVDELDRGVARWAAELRGIKAAHEARVRSIVRWDFRRTVLVIVMATIPLWLPALVWTFAP
jgi:hypothetical protein